jgi:hypothetical protein
MERNFFKKAEHINDQVTLNSLIVRRKIIIRQRKRKKRKK